METVTVELLKMEGFQLDFCVGSLVKCKLSEEWMNEGVQPLRVSVLRLDWGPESGVATWVCAEIIRLRTPAVLLLGILKSMADVLRLSSSPHIWCSGIHGKRNHDKLFSHSTNRFFKFLIFFPCVAGQDIYVNLSVLKASLKYLNQEKKMYSYESKYKCFSWKGGLEGLARTQFWKCMCFAI